MVRFLARRAVLERPATGRSVPVTVTVTEGQDSDRGDDDTMQGHVPSSNEHPGRRDMDTVGAGCSWSLLGAP